MKKVLAFLSIVILLGIAYYVYQSLAGPRLFKDLERRRISIGGRKYALYIADTEQRRLMGLSGINDMPFNQGMLFIFENPDTYGFWMKDMNFPLDFVYIKDSKVIELKENIAPGTFPQIFYPLAPIDAVVEFHAGQIQQSDVHIGDIVHAFK